MMKNILKKCLPIRATYLIQRVVGLANAKTIKISLKKIYSIKCKNIGIYKLAKCGKKYKDFIDDYIETKIFVYKDNNLINVESVVTLICVVKDDLIRVKMVLDYYRSIGVKKFIFLDDDSKDGTLEFLLEQKDVKIYKSNKQYNTLRRQVWINKIIEENGYNRWYLVVDSDEIFDYENSETININDYCNNLKEKNIYRVKSLLLDMFSDNKMYDNSPMSHTSIQTKYNLFLPNYRLEKNLYDYVIYGGGRERLMKDAKKPPVVSKTPLVFVNPNTVFINSHYIFPFTPVTKFPSTVLRHYKFLAGDRERYLKRIELKNFSNNSDQYLQYNKIDDSEYIEIVNDMIEYKNFKSTKKISVIRN